MSFSVETAVCISNSISIQKQLHSFGLFVEVLVDARPLRLLQCQISRQKGGSDASSRTLKEKIIYLFSNTTHPLGLKEADLYASGKRLSRIHDRKSISYICVQEFLLLVHTMVGVKWHQNWFKSIHYCWVRWGEVKRELIINNKSI